MMLIPLLVENKLYAKDTVVLWTIVWERICRMAYENADICQELITLPEGMIVDGIQSSKNDELEHADYYQKGFPDNHNQILFDSTWRRISKRFGAPYTIFVVPELRKLHVPRCLFDSLGVSQFFRHSFPNCVITFWGE